MVQVGLPVWPPSLVVWLNLSHRVCALQACGPLQQQLSRWTCHASAAAGGSAGAGDEPSKGSSEVVLSPLEQSLGAVCKTLTNLFPL